MTQSTNRRALRMKQLTDKTGLRKSQLLEAVRLGLFPRPFHILPGGRAVAWDEAEVDQHLERQMAEREAPKAAKSQKEFETV
jgi:predicted DNA-binding transcriptional regulator AlpA